MLPDSGALRVRRSRAHKAGDHSLCRRCVVLRAEAAGEGQEIPADDTAKMRWLAGTLAQAYQADPGNALLARELRMTLQALLGRGDGPEGRDDELAGLFAEFGAS